MDPLGHAEKFRFIWSQSDFSTNFKEAWNGHISFKILFYPQYHEWIRKTQTETETEK